MERIVPRAIDLEGSINSSNYTEALPNTPLMRRSEFQQDDKCEVSPCLLDAWGIEGNTSRMTIRKRPPQLNDQPFLRNVDRKEQEDATGA